VHGNTTPRQGLKNCFYDIFEIFQMRLRGMHIFVGMEGILEGQEVDRKAYSRYSISKEQLTVKKNVVSIGALE